MCSTLILFAYINIHHNIYDNCIFIKNPKNYNPINGSVVSALPNANKRELHKCTFKCSYRYTTFIYINDIHVTMRVTSSSSRLFFCHNLL